MKMPSMKNKLIILFSLLLVIAFTVGGVLTEAQSATKRTTKKKTKKVNPDDPTSVIYLGTKGQLAGRGDPDKPAGIGYQKGRAWHPQALEAAGLPKDKFGLVDWAKIVREGLIKPKHSLDPNADEFPPLQMDVVIKAKGDYVNDVLYPHEIHTWWLKCEVCHPKIFVPAAGQNNMSMIGIVKGKWCGRCHNKVAFPLSNCTRCHTVPKKKVSKK
jgi:c(7)-type cytochrome triheme protein